MMTKRMVLVVITTFISFNAFSFETTRNYEEQRDESFASHSADSRLVKCKSLDARIELQVYLVGNHVASEKRLIISEKFVDGLGQEYTENTYDTRATQSQLKINGRIVRSNRGEELYTSEVNPQFLGIYLNSKDSTDDLARYEVMIWNKNDVQDSVSNEELKKDFGFENIREHLARGGYLARLTGYKRYNPKAGVDLYDKNQEIYLLCK
jgi:hypothetical protein